MRANDREFDCSIYAIPNQDDLERALNELDVEKVADAETKADVSIDELENA
jgi:chemotaxis protein CheC